MDYDTSTYKKLWNWKKAITQVISGYESREWGVNMSKFLCGQFDIQIIKKIYFLKSMYITAINFFKKSWIWKGEKGIEREKVKELWQNYIILKNKLNLFKKSINLTMEFGLSPMYMLSTCPKTEQHPRPISVFSYNPESWEGDSHEGIY